MQFKNRRPRWAVFAVAAAASVALAGCAASAAEPTATHAPAKDEVLSINLVDTAPGTKVKIAEAQDFFAKHNLKVTLSTLDNGTAVLAALQGGSADIGYADLYAGINANANKFPVVFIVANNHNTRAIPWLTKADSGINSPKDLEGKTIGVAPVPQHTVNLRGFLKANGVDADKVKITTIDSTEGAQEILQSGAVDVIQGTWPVAFGNEGKEGQYNFKVVGNPDTDQWTEEGATTAGFWATREWAENHEEAAQRFADAWREYNAWLLDRTTDERLALLKEYQGLDVDALVGDDPDKQKYLIGWTEQEDGFNFEASQAWYDLGLEYAPDRIKSGVNLKDIVWKTAIVNQ